jgi:hypothetical protein
MNNGQKETLCQYFTRNALLIVLLCVSLIASVAFFRPLLGAVIGQEHCKMHHDQFLGKLWLECPEAIRQVFGPFRRP